MSLAPSPTHMVSLNKTPARAIILVEEVVKKLQPDHHILHAANSRSECATFVALMFADFTSFLIAIGDLEMIMTSLVVKPSLIVSNKHPNRPPYTKISQN